MSWRQQAACIGKNATFFPHTGGSTAKAREICDGCPVAEECLEYSITEALWYGVWGGHSATERQRLADHKLVLPYRGVGRPQKTWTDCLFGDSATCGTRRGYTRGCRGEHCLARERTASAESRRRRKERQAHDARPEAVVSDVE